MAVYSKISRVIKNPAVRSKLREWLPILILLVILTVSFVYGWVLDDSKPIDGIGWADQTLYAKTVETIRSGNLPTAHQLHYAVGYPLLGVLGSVILASHPFMIISLALLLGSAIFCYIAVKHLFGAVWATIFTVLLFYWDGVSRTFHNASELFVVPWNNQVLFFAFAFFFWLFTTRSSKIPSTKLVVVTSVVCGISFLTREEAILFVLPALISFLYLTKAGWKKLALGLSIMILCFVPQVAAKLNAFGTLSTSGHDASYGTTLKDKYFQPELLLRNTQETIIDSRQDTNRNVKRQALLQAAPLLWLSPIGFMIVFLDRKYTSGTKIFLLISSFLLIFYLSGSNMSAQKLAFNCLRYISPSFIALYFGVVVALRFTTNFIILHNPLKKTA